MASPVSTASAADLSFGSAAIHRDLSTAALIETAIHRGEGVLAANGALNVDTGDRTGRSPNDKYLEDTQDIHDSIAWGKVNKPIQPATFAELEQLAVNHLSGKQELFRFDGYAGADPDYRLNVSVITEEAWHCLFAKTLFINAPAAALRDFEPDWTILNACNLHLDDHERYGLNSPVLVETPCENINLRSERLGRSSTTSSTVPLWCRTQRLARLR